MSDQGERNEPRGGEDGDWWSQLYDPSAPDTGGSPAGDTIDDRFASARAVGASAPWEPPEPAPAEPAPTAQAAPGEPGLVDPPPRRDAPPVTAEPPRDADTAPERAAWLDRLFGNDPAEEELWPPGEDDDARTAVPGTDTVNDAGEGATEEDGAENRSVAEPTAQTDPAPYADNGPDPGTEASAADPADPSDPAGEGSPPGSVGANRRAAPGGARRRSVREVFGYGGRHGGASGAAVPSRGRLVPPEPGEPTAAAPGALSDLVPDTILDGARHGALALRAVSGRGGSARRRGEPRGDALLTARFGTGASALLFVAVAVGAGAAPAGRRAAREVCQSIGEAVGRSRPRLVEDIVHDRRATLSGGLKRLTDRCYGRLRAQAAALELGAEEYHADLRCLLAPMDPACTTRVVFGAGGGGLFRLRDGSWTDLEPQPESAPDARGGVPVRLPDPREPEAVEEAAPGPPPFRFRAVSTEPGDALLLCSAGLALPLRGDPAFADQLAESWSGRTEAPDLATFLTDVQYPAPAYGDDRTAVTLWHATR